MCGFVGFSGKCQNKDKVIGEMLQKFSTEVPIPRKAISTTRLLWALQD